MTAPIDELLHAVEELTQMVDRADPKQIDFAAVTEKIFELTETATDVIRVLATIAWVTADMLKAHGLPTLPPNAFFGFVDSTPVRDPARAAAWQLLTATLNDDTATVSALAKAAIVRGPEQTYSVIASSLGLFRDLHQRAHGKVLL